jgi:hypothetical protein
MSEQTKHYKDELNLSTRVDALRLLMYAEIKFGDKHLGHILFNNLYLKEDALINYNSFKILSTARKLKKLGYEISNIEDYSDFDCYGISIRERKK